MDVVRCPSTKVRRYSCSSQMNWLAASGFCRKSRLYFGIPSKKARELLTDPFVIFYSIDIFACASPHWWEFFEINVSSQRRRLLVRRKIPGRRFRLTRRNLACSPTSTEARCTEVKSGGLDLMRPPIGRSPLPALPSQLPSAVQPIRRFLLFSWL
jgi:hypothetical protein